MLFGHNTNVTLEGTVFHVQTEDRGVNSAALDTTVHCRGRVLHRRTNKYHDLLPLDAEKEKALKTRLDEQHFGVVEELKSGALKVEAPPAPPSRPLAPGPSGSARNAATSPAPALAVEMLNPRTWLSGKHATLYLVVRSKDSATPIAGARVVARVEGSIEPTATETETAADGHARLEFDMPKLAGDDAALVIEASSRDAQGQLRFALRAKPKTPAVN
ncbi:MAG: hypothetical protein JO119_18395 [Acidobacteria bacterium]|nr:hypothetical protein [Acidobacteriota bacterium]